MGQPPDLVGSPEDGGVNCPWRIVESPQDIALVAGHEKVGSPYPTCAAANGNQSWYL